MSSTSFKNAKYGIFSDEFKQWIQVADLSALAARGKLPPPLIRQAVKEAEALIPDPFPGIKYEDLPIIAEGVSARVFRQKDQSLDERNLRPLALILHGGGWIIGTHNSEAGIIEALVGKLGFVGVSIEYRLAPEHPYPIPFNDSYGGFQWVIENATKFGADPNCIFVAGSSAGANLAAAITLKARDEGLNNIKAQILIIPATCDYRHHPKDRYELESYETCKNVPILPAENMTGYWKSYNPEGLADVTISPLLAESHEGLPPAYFQIAGSDVLRDEGLAYAEALQAAGVATKLDIYPGVPHAFTIRLFGFLTAKRAEDDLEERARWMLGLVKGEGSL